MSLIVKIIILSFASPLPLSAPPPDKTQWFVHLSFNYTSQLINGFSSDLHKLLKYFNGTAITAFVNIPLTAFGVG